MLTPACILRIAIPSPLRRSFDYLPPANIKQTLLPGMRIKVPFGRSQTIGILLEVATQTDIDIGRLRNATAVLDRQPVLETNSLRLLQWACQYYQYPIGEVLHAALPGALRTGKAATLPKQVQWQLLPPDQRPDFSSLSRAPKQQQIVKLLEQQAQGLYENQLNQQLQNWRPSMQRLQQHSWVESIETEMALDVTTHPSPAQVLNSEQQLAVDNVLEHSNEFHSWLLEGVTGSGKTEVYLQIIQQIIDKHHQALVLVPEIGLTPQTLQRFRRRFAVPVVMLHSGMNDSERLHAWLAASTGQARIIIGTRSAVFTPMPELGVIIVDEEHDISFKQQDGFRYHARDVAIKRAADANIPIVLGSATPSFETLQNAKAGRYRHLQLQNRFGNASRPDIRLISMRNQQAIEGFAPVTLKAIETHLQRGEQVLVFLNRRGFAPTLMCFDCQHILSCQRCDARLTWHQQAHRLRCHHCGAEQALPKTCPECQSRELHPVGQGTERLEHYLEEHFNAFGIIRIDRDTTRRRNAFAEHIEAIKAGKYNLLIGTQMLAKGHHFPDVTLVVVINADQGLFGIDLRASERLAQLIVQVAGRAGRAEKPGQVLIQTWQPEHPLMLTLQQQDYRAYAEQALQERQQAAFPPFSSMAIIRAEATQPDMPLQFLDEVRDMLQTTNCEVAVLGPVDAPMRRRAGRYRAQLLLQAQQRGPLQQLLSSYSTKIEGLKSARKVRWSIDVDPQEML